MEPTAYHGLLVIDKPGGMTSRAVIDAFKSAFPPETRLGHAGTLDPLATGVLPILFESATRLAEFAHRLPKTYVADIHLGFATATDDAEAEPQPVGDPSGVSREDVAQALAEFTGRILQEPPAFSAVKVDGKRAYRLARQGADPKPAAREVDVYESRVLDFTPGPHAVSLHGRGGAYVTVGLGGESIPPSAFRALMGQGFGRTVLLFDNADRAALAELGEVRTPSIADLFVAVLGNGTQKGKLAA